MSADEDDVVRAVLTMLLAVGLGLVSIALAFVALALSPG